MPEVAVGLLDTALAPRFAVRAARSFVAEVRATGHGDALAQILCSGAPRIELLSAAVFDGRAPASADAVADGLHWLIGQGAQLINLSFGLREDRKALRCACAQALERGVLLVASAPAQGAAVFPAAYPQVLRITGDARCAPGEFSALDNGQAEFGACVGGPRHRPGEPGGGASWAAAHASAALAAWLAAGGAGEPRQQLLGLCRYHGAERRSG